MKLYIFLSFLLIGGSIPIGFSQEYNGIERTIADVGKEIDPNGIGFDIEYTLEGTLDPEVIINQDEKSVTFFYHSMGIDEDVLIIHLPRGLIEEPIGIYVDGVQDTNAIRSMQGNITTLYIPLFENDKEITVYGTNVIPEFGSIVILILLVSLSAAMILPSKIKLQN